MKDTKHLFENFRKFTELKAGGANKEIVSAWKQELYDWVKANAKREDKDALGAAMHQVADEMMVMEESEDLDEEDDPCWDGYEMVGMKNKDGKEVPNCVPIKESAKLSEEQIDELIEEFMNQLEEGGSCDGPTKKTSSTAKGKKWMQCVKNPDGKGYKRVHWGQKGVRVTGKSGNTKRKKSFRARHGCSDAKPGTAKYMACKDW